VTTSSGYWTKTAWGTTNVPKTGVAGVLESWLSEETIKRIERWTAAAARPLAERLELTPLADPLALAPGDKLRLLVTLGGRPVAGVPVAYDGDVRGTTAADGTIALRIRRPGLQMIRASAEAPLADGRADTVVRAATLNFELPAR
jgi:nickel transport protein